MEINIKDERKAFENAWLVPHELEFFDFDLKKNQYLLKEQYVSDDESPIANETYHSLNSGWSMWLKAKVHEAEKLNGCVVVPVKTPDQFTSKLDDHLLELWIGDWGCDWDGFVSVNGIKPENIWSMVVEAARGGND